MESFKKKRDESQKDESKHNDNVYKTLVAHTKSGMPSRTRTRKLSHKAFIDSDAISHMMTDVSVTTGKDVTLDIRIGMADRDIINAVARLEANIEISGR